MTPGTAKTVTTGIRSKDREGCWCVPPWRVETRLSGVVQHFLRFTHYFSASMAELVSYYEGYLSAIENAPKDELRSEMAWEWYGDLHYCIRRCIATYREELAREGATVGTAVRHPPSASASASALSRDDLASVS